MESVLVNYYCNQSKQAANLRKQAVIFSLLPPSKETPFHAVLMLWAGPTYNSSTRKSNISLLYSWTLNIGYGPPLKYNKCFVFQVVRLKQGCPVILLMNLTDKLVNGLRGEVIKLCPNSVVCRFPSINLQWTLEPQLFTR